MRTATAGKLDWVGIFNFADYNEMKREGREKGKTRSYDKSSYAESNTTT